MRDVSQSRLIKRAKGYDPEALDELYSRYADAVFRYIYYRVGDRQVAEDLVGDVFVRAMEALPTYQDVGNPFDAWLYRIAHARVVDYYRRQKVRQTTVLDEQMTADGRSDPDQLVAQAEDIGRVWAVLSQLTEEQQQVVSLRFIAGYSTAEVAKVVGKTEGSVRALQHRALASLRRLLLDADP